MIRRTIALILALLLAAGCAAEEILYTVDVDLTNQVVTVYSVDDQSETGIVRQMICSSGGEGDETPMGEFVVDQFYPDERTEWYYIKGYEVYVQYVTRFNGPILFHSLPYFEKDVSTIDTEARSMLGEAVSHGCIRLRSEDSKWLALNCPDGTKVRVFESGVRDEHLRKQLLRRSYVAADWESYLHYLDADIAAGLTGVLEAQARQAALG